MSSSRRGSLTPARVLLAVFVGSLSLAVFVASALEVPRDRVTIVAVVVGTLLVVGALALPALLFVGWQSDRE